MLWIGIKILASIGFGLGLRALLRSDLHLLRDRSINYWIKYLLVLDQNRQYKPIECDTCLSFWGAILIFTLPVPSFVLYALTTYAVMTLINRKWI